MKRVPPSILITGFEPFGAERVNPSALLALRLHGLRFPADDHDATVVGRVLPCAFNEARKALRQALHDAKPTLVVCLGLAAGREGLTFERVALNLIDARIVDNEGAQPIDVRVVRTPRDAYLTTLPVKAMVQAALDQGVHAALSLSAGTYVCNAVFFELMHGLAQQRRLRAKQRTSLDVRGGFVHVPLLEGAHGYPGDAPSMTLDAMATGLQAAIGAALRTSDDLKVAGGSIA